MLTLVPILVGVLSGVLGPILSQLVNAWRERKREELRWERDKIKDQDNHYRELENLTRQESLKLYADVINQTERFRGELSTIRALGRRDPDKCDQLTSILNDLSFTTSQIEIIGSADTRKAARQHLLNCDKALRKVTDSEIGDDHDKYSVGQSYELAASYLQFIYAARREYNRQ